MELSCSTPPFLALRFGEKDLPSEFKQYSLCLGIFFHHEDALTPGPPKTDEMQCNATTTMHWCTSLMDRHPFTDKRFFANRSMTALLISTDEVHAQPVSVKHFCLKNRFFC
jgi:hypothetical protein